MNNITSKIFDTTIILGNCLIGLLALGLAGCESSTSNQAKEDQRAFKKLEQSDLSTDVKKEKIEAIIQGLPSASEVPELLRKSGAGFNPNLPNTLDRVDSYRSTSFKASTNLGVYAADIGYLCSYGKSQEALNYLEGSKLLADHLGVTNAFDLEFIRKFEDSIGSPDYLLELIDESINRVSKFLQTEDRIDLSILVLSGGFVEGLYLTTSLLQLYTPDRETDDSSRKIYAIVYDLASKQKTHLSSLINLLKSLEPGSGIESFIVQLEDLNNMLELGYSDSGERRRWIRNLNQKAFKIRENITS